MFSKILVTGGSAVAGSAFKSIQDQYPNSEFIFIGSKDCNLTDQTETFNFIEKNQPDAIIHLAAISGGVGLSTKYPATILRDNVLMNFNILEAARTFKVKKVIMTLSSGMYPPDAPIPLKEEYTHLGPPHGSNYSYSFAKRLVEPSIRAYRDEYDLNVIGLIPNGIFGENDNFNFDDAPMLPSLIRRFYENKNSDEKIVIWGDGSPLREYTYSQDLARAYLWCLDYYNEAQILNVGSIEENSVKDTAFMIAEILGIDKNRIEFDTSKPKGVFKKSTDNSKFLKLSDFKYTPFREALEKTIQWFRETCEKSPDNLRLHSKINSSKSNI